MSRSIFVVQESWDECLVTVLHYHFVLMKEMLARVWTIDNRIVIYPDALLADFSMQINHIIIIIMQRHKADESQARGNVDLRVAVSVIKRLKFFFESICSDVQVASDDVR